MFFLFFFLDAVASYFHCFYLSQVSQQFWSDQQRGKSNAKDLPVNRDFLSSGPQLIFGKLWLLLLELLNGLEKETSWQKWLSCISFRRTSVRLASLDNRIHSLDIVLLVVEDNGELCLYVNFKSIYVIYWGFFASAGCASLLEASQIFSTTCGFV